MTSAEGDLPYVDEHAIRIAAPRAQVWAALQRYAAGLGMPEGSRVARILATVPPTGFAVTESLAPERLELRGQHRFSQYRLSFELVEVSDELTQVRAQTYAAFPGPAGQVYRTLVIGSGGHAIATHQILRSLRRQSEHA